MVEPGGSLRHSGVEVVRGRGLAGVELHLGTRVHDSFRPHFHNEAHITCVLSGGRTQSVGRKRYTLDPGDSVVVPSGEVHESRSRGANGWSFVAIYCSPRSVRRAVESLAHEPDLREGELQYRRSGDPQLGRRIRGLARSLAETPLAAEVAWIELIARLMRGDRPPPPLRRQRKTVRRVRAFLEDHVADAVTLDQLAELSGVSKEHLVRSFTAEVGLPPHAYLLNARIERAKPMLLAGESIIDVALRLGFHDQSHFSRHFRRIVGIPPGQFARSRQRA